MIKSMLLFLILLLSACATFDKTNIQPGERVKGLGFSFTVPTEKSWFAVEYGTSHRIKLSQLNDDDRYSILISLNRGPRFGMYPRAEDHLSAAVNSYRMEPIPTGLTKLFHKEWLDLRYGELCVRQTSLSEDWRGRNNKGPAIVETIELTCEHQELENVLISIELSRRYEKDSAAIELATYADEIFSSIEYFNIE